MSYQLVISGDCRNSGISGPSFQTHQGNKLAFKCQTSRRHQLKCAVNDLVTYQYIFTFPRLENGIWPQYTKDKAKNIFIFTFE